MRPRTRIISVAAAAAVALLATACASSPAKTTKTSGAVSASFTFALPDAPISLDIPKDFDGNIMLIMALVTEKLERISPTGQLSPDLATSVTQPDATTLVYHIRSGVRFSDGSPLTAADVAWSLQHVTDVKAGAETAGNAASFASATVTGPLQVTVKLKYPDPTARKNLSVISFIQEAKFGQAHLKDLGTPGAVPVGTGPYEVSGDTTQAVTLTRNPYYWGPKPPAAKIVFTFIPTDTSAQLAMRSGSIQGALVGDLKTASAWQAISGTTLYSLPSLYTNFLTLDTSTGPLSDVHVRKAITYSLDRAGVMAAAFGQHATLLKGLATPGLLADVAPSAAAAQTFLNGLPQYNFDLAAAKAELAQSAYPHGFSLTAPYITGDTASQLTVLNLQQNMKQLGVTIIPKAESGSQWIAVIYAHGKNLGMQFMALTPPIPDPAALLGAVTGTQNIRPQGFNLANWSTPAADQASTELARSTDVATRWLATQTLLSAIAADVPYIPLYSPDTLAALGGGWRFDTPQNLFDLDVNGTWAFHLTAG
ncbi:MAG: ABC transporter substrate-binding protein [Streptosporangiaceae bacterium]